LLGGPVIWRLSWRPGLAARCRCVSGPRAVRALPMLLLAWLVARRRASRRGRRTAAVAGQNLR